MAAVKNKTTSIILTGIILILCLFPSIASAKTKYIAKDLAQVDGKNYYLIFTLDENYILTKESYITYKGVKLQYIPRLMGYLYPIPEKEILNSPYPFGRKFDLDLL